ncbi:MAG: spondin domain-containing protein [Alphaproteobacteria bacterium]|nr:spondin domain-containing protein [Alphaproteobacteria bacterium]
MNPALLTLLLGCPPPVFDDDTAAQTNTTFTLTLENVSAPGSLVASDSSTHDQMFAPGIYVIHTADVALFEEGVAASDALEQLAEDGDPAALFAALDGADGVAKVDYLGPEDSGTYETNPLLPGDLATEEFSASDGYFLSIATMLGESNDVFLATPSGGLPLFTDDAPLSGDLTAELRLWDAGTELNQEPGIGADQAPRQANPGDGEAEGGVVQQLEGTDAAGWSYPPVSDLVSAGITAVTAE